jgi:hypothetical protein
VPDGKETNRVFEPLIPMSDWSPKSVWERVRRAIDGWMEEGEADHADVMFLLLFLAPVFLAFVVMLRR